MKKYTANEIEDIIKGFKQIKARINILEEERESIQETGISAMSFVEVKIKSNNIYSVTEETAIENTEKTKIIENKIYILKKRLNILNEAINSITTLEKNIIVMKLIDDEPYFKICGDLSISKRHAINLKNRALKKIARLINENTNFFD